MEKIIPYVIACLLFIALLVSCTTDEMEPPQSASPFENPKAGLYIEIYPIKPCRP